MKHIFQVDTFAFPYRDYHFPGQNSGEYILFITRESPIMQNLRKVFLITAVCVFLLIMYTMLEVSRGYIPQLVVLQPVAIVLSAVIVILGWWWISETYRKSLFIITTRRLTKIIYTTPVTWYQFSLGLDEIADTGSYSSTYFEALFHLGYFVARSGAAAIKNFKIVNITFAADLHNYVNKLLYAFKHHPSKIDNFRPFIPHLKGEERKKHLQEYPEYKTEF
jgi:hypothetical protein